MERTGGSYIYSQLRGAAESSAWRPEYIEGKFGIETSASLNNFISDARSGTMVNYTARDESQIKLAFYDNTVYSFPSKGRLGTDIYKVAQSHNVEIFADDIKNVATARDLPNNPTQLGEYNHSKLAQVITESGLVRSRIMTANLTESALNGNQANVFIESSNDRFNYEVSTYQQYLKTGKLPPNVRNFKYLSITSPQTPFQTVQRVATAFGSEDSKQTLYITSATLTSPLTMAIAKAQLAKGGKVNIVTETFNKNTESTKEAEGIQLARLQLFASGTAGELNFGTYSSTTPFSDTHANAMVQGETFSVGSERSSNTAQRGNQAEATLIAKNKIISKQMQAYFEENFQWSSANSAQDLRGLKHKNQFVEFVNTQKIQRNIDIVIPAQMNKKFRQMYHEALDYNFQPAHQGILTNAYAEYATRDPKYKTDVEAYNAVIKNGRYMELLSIQADWVNKFTWGETWGQLGNRGAISTLILMGTKLGDEKLNAWFLSEEDSARRFYTFYKPLPVEKGEVLTDTFRQGIDYFENIEMNLLMFNSATTVYSLLLLQGTKLIKATSENIVGKIPGSGDFLDRVKGKGVNKITPFWLARGMASEAAMMLFGPVSGALDVLMGSGGAGGWQFTNEKSIKHTTNTARGHRDVNRLMMFEGYNFTRNNPFMKITGVSVLSEVFVNMHNYISNIGVQIRKKTFNWRTSAGILKYQLFYDTPNAAALMRAEKNPAIHPRLSSRKIISFGVFMAIGLDQFTAYLGENLGGIDAARVERANQILREAAQATGNIHPVQLARTSNVGVDWTGNGWKDTYLALINAPKAVYRSVENLVRNIFTTNMRNFLGPAAIEKGREMEAAQQAMARGDEDAAIKYALLAQNGSKSFKDDLFKGDLWKTWIFQIAQNPLQFTYTLAINQRRINDPRAGNVEIQEYGYTLQGPVAIRIGISTDVPYQFYKKLNYKNQKDLPFEPWVYQFRPGSNWVNSFTVAAVLHAGDISFRGVTWAAAKGLNSVVSPRYPIFTEFANEAQKWAFGSEDSRYMNQTYKAGSGGAKLTISGRMSVMKAAMSILMLPATLPIMTKAIAFNIVANLTELGIFGLEASRQGAGSGSLTKWLSRRDASGNVIANSLSNLGRAWQDYKGAWFINSIERDLLREAMDINTLEDFHRAFGDTSTEFSKVDQVKLQTQFDEFKTDTRKFMKRLSIRNPFNVIQNMKNTYIARFSKAVIGTGSAAMIALGLSYAAVSIEAGYSVAHGQNILSTVGFTLGNKLLAWSASNTEKMQAAVDNTLAPHSNTGEKVTWLYKLAASIDSSSKNLWPFLQSIAKMMSGAARLIDTSGSGVPNIVSAIAASIGEIFIGASASMENVKWNAVTRQYDLKDSASLYKPGLISAIGQAFAGGLKAFQNGFYLPFGMDQYLMMGPFGITKTEVDKDTTEWASTFSQASLLMFLTSGYSEKFMLKGSLQQREYLIYKEAARNKYEPMGMRTLNRERAIRSGKMYHDDIISDATSWGMRIEMARRSELFRWIKHVDARDVLEIPGLVSKDGKYYDIDRFKDPATEQEAAIYNIMRALNSKIFKYSKPGHLEQADEEINLDSAMLAEQRQAEALGPNGIATTLDNARLVPQGSLATIFLGVSVAAGVLGVFKVLQHTVDWHKISQALGSLASSFGFSTIAEKLHKVAKTQEYENLKRLRNILPKAHFKELGRGLMFLEIDGIAYSRGPTNTFSKIVKDILKVTGAEEKDLRNIFFVAEEVKGGTIAPFTRILNKYDPFIRTLQKLENAKTLKIENIFGKLEHIATQLEGFRKDAEVLHKLISTRSAGSANHIEHLNNLQKFIDGMKSAETRTNRLLKLYTDLVLGDSTLLSKAQSLTDEILLENGRQTTLLDELKAIQQEMGMGHKPGQSVAKQLIELMKGTGEISEIGLVKKGGIITDIFKKFLVQFGVDKSILEKASSTLLSAHEDILDIKLLGDTSVESKLKPGFIKFADFDKVFKAKFLQQLVSELKTLGYETDDLMRDVVQYLKSSNNPGLGQIEKKLVEGLLNGNGAGSIVASALDSPKITLDQIKQLISQLVDAGKLDPAAANSLIEDRLNTIWAKTQVKTGLDIAGKTLTEGTEVHLFGKYKVNANLVSFTKSFLLTGIQRVFDAIGISGALAAAWYATEAHNPIYNEGQRKEFAKVAQEENVTAMSMGLTTAIMFAAKKFFSVSAGGAATVYEMLLSQVGTNGIRAIFFNGLRLVAGLFVGGGTLAAGIVPLTTAALLSLLVFPSILGESDEQLKVQKGLELKDSFSVGFGIDFKNSLSSSLHSWFVKTSSETTRNYYLGKQNLGNVIFNFLFHESGWDPTKFNRPGPGMLWHLLDPIMRGLGAFDPTKSVPPSLDPHSHQPFLERSAIFIGTGDTDNAVNQFIVNLGISEQQSRLMSKPESWAYELYHPTLFGVQAKNEIIGANKDGTDPLAPGWLQDDFRHKMFKEQSTVLSQGMEAVLKMRGSLETQVLSNLADQKHLMGRVLLVSPENIYDPRSGGDVLPGDTYLVSVVGSEVLGTSYAQPREDLRHPAFEGKMSGLRNKRVGAPAQPVNRGPGVVPPASPGKPSPPVPVSSSRKEPAIAAKKDPYTVAMNNVAVKVEKAKSEAETRVAQQAKNPIYLVVPNAEVAPTDAHVIACDTSVAQHRRDAKFSTRGVKSTKSGVVLDAYRAHDNYDIENSVAYDTFNTGTNQNWLDTWS